MPWWPWLYFTWLLLGCVGLLVAKLTLRVSGTHDPLTLDHDWPTAIGAGFALVLAGPMVLLFMVGLCVKSISEGRIPVTNRVWWRARARKFPIPEPPSSPQAKSLEDQSPETLLCQMIEIRRASDPRLRQREAPDNWPMFMLWKTTESSVLGMVEAYCWLCDGGLKEEEALQRLNAAQSGISILRLEKDATLRTFIADRLTIEDPDYITLGPGILADTVDLAKAWSKANITRNKTDRPYPPLEWLKAKVRASDIEAEMSLPFKDSGIFAVTDGQAEAMGTIVPIDPKWRRIKLRMVPGDELWTFSSPADSWKSLAGRMGVALIRAGHPIAHVTTLMN